MIRAPGMTIYIYGKGVCACEIPVAHFMQIAGLCVVGAFGPALNTIQNVLARTENGNENELEPEPEPRTKIAKLAQHLVN